MHSFIELVVNNPIGLYHPSPVPPPPKKEKPDPGKKFPRKTKNINAEKKTRGKYMEDTEIYTLKLML